MKLPLVRHHILYILSALLYVISMTIVYFDTQHTYRWLAFFIFLLALSLVTIRWLRSLPRIRLKRSPSFGITVITLFIISTFSRTYLLQEYPFVSLGDQLRDGGLNAYQIYDGQIKNIFAYGTSESHGLIIPIISSAFYHFLGSSVLVFRLSAAIFSVLDILLIFLLVLLITRNKFIAFIGSYSLVCLPLHLFFSRTEIVVILSSFLSTMTLLTFFIFLKRKAKNVHDYIFLSTLIGFLLIFHASLRVYLFLIIPTIICCCVGLYLLKKLTLSKMIQRIILIAVFLLVGFGPTILNTNSSIFFKKTRLPATSSSESEKSQVIQTIAVNYKRSLLVWITENTTSWYPHRVPILTPILFFVMILGILWSFKERNYFLILCLGFSLVIHFTNSAITDLPNGEHRLAPLYPIAAVFMAMGVLAILQILKIRPLQFIFVFVSLIYLSSQLYSFFVNQPANMEFPITPYLSMHTIYFLKENPELVSGNPLIFELSPHNYENFNFTHYKQQYEYFFPKSSFILQSSPNISDNQIYITLNADKNYNTYSYRCKNRDYLCPLQFNDEITIFFR